MRSVELAGAIGIIFGGPQKKVLHGELMRSVGTGLAPEPRRDYWAPDGILTSVGQRRETIHSEGYSVANRQWSDVPRGHSRSRHGNQRP